MSKKQMTKIADDDKSTVEAVQSETTGAVPKRSHQQAAKSSGRREKSDCNYCSYSHVRGRCPAYGETCNKCGIKNHFEKVCESTKVQSIENKDADKQMNSLFISAVDVTSSQAKRRSWILPMLVGHGKSSKDVAFNIDAGAETNCINLNALKSLKAKLKPTTTRLYGYNRTNIHNFGQVQLKVKHQDKCHQLHVEVIDEDFPPILGLEASETFGLVHRVDEVSKSVLDDYPEVFDGVGRLEGSHEICVDKDVKPVIHCARHVPISMLDRVRKELDSMERSGIVEKVDKPTNWVSSMVCIEKKDGSVRICLDPKDLNRAVKREHHKIPTMEDIAFRFAGMQHYTIMDMKHGYWHVALTDESSLLTTFNTPFGRYCFRRLPFGLHSSAEVFERKVEQIFGDLPGVSVYFDDIIVAGKTQQEHDTNLKQLLEKAKNSNVKFNRNKIQLNQIEV